MQLPIPPSDSLYKFLCIGSMLGSVALFIWSDKQVSDLELRQAELTRRRAIVQAEVKMIKEDSDFLRREISESRRAGREAMKRELPSLGDANLKLHAQLQMITVKAVEMAEDEKEMRRLVREIDRDLNWRFYQLGLFGFLFVSSLIYWYLQVQHHQDRVLRAQAETAELALKKARAEDQDSGATRTGAAP